MTIILDISVKDAGAFSVLRGRGLHQGATYDSQGGAGDFTFVNVTLSDAVGDHML